MKRINYIIGICILAASLITAATQGYILFDEGMTETKAGDEHQSHEVPNEYWPNGTWDQNVLVKEPEDFNPQEGKDSTFKVTEWDQTEFKLSSMIPDGEKYTYFCIYRDPKAYDEIRQESISGWIGGSLTPHNRPQNDIMRQYGKQAEWFMWYYSEKDRSYVDFRNNLKYYSRIGSGDDRLILEVSTDNDYYCQGDQDNTGGGYFLKPKNVTRYNLIIDDNRVLKYPTQYWEKSTADVKVKLPSDLKGESEVIEYTGVFVKSLKPVPDKKIEKQNFYYDYICIVADPGIEVTKGASTDNGNRQAREYKTVDGKTVVVWYRTTEDGRYDPYLLNGSPFTVSSTVTVEDEATCDVYYGEGYLDEDFMDTNNRQLDLSNVANMKKVSYIFKDTPPTQSMEIPVEPKQTIRHEKIDTLYVLPNERIKILQQTQTTGGIQGYIAWHSPEGEGKGYEWYKDRITFDYGNFKYYQNGVAFFRDNTTLAGDMPTNLCYIYFHAIDIQDEDDTATLIWDASSVLGAEVVEGKLMPPYQITIRHKYIIKHAGSRIAQLKAAKEAYDKAGSDDKIGSLNTAGFFERYEIHTPYYGADNGTSFRLAEPLSNYYLKNTINNNLDLHQACASAVRWSVYNKDGEKVSFDWYDIKGNKTTVTGSKIIHTTTWDGNASGGAVEWPNIFFCKNLGYIDKYNYEQKKFYITAEVGENQNAKTWYPVSFLTVYLEPYADFRTETELRDAPPTSEYRMRYQDEIEKEYVCLDSITFDAVPGGIPDYSKIEDATKNYRSSTLDKDLSEYAVSASFTYDQRYNYKGDPVLSEGGKFLTGRATGTRTVHRGEYALFKTLNDPTYSSRNQFYKDWFCWPEGVDGKSKTGNYFVKVYDRHYEYRQTRGLGDDEMGYFMYVDATEVPGVIVKLPVDSSALCQGTRLLVTAWVCNLQSNSPGSIAADLGFTFKGVSKNKEEKILNKFYTGAARSVPSLEDGAAANPGNPLRAEWQQVYFYFTIKPGEATYNSYLLEVANNCRHSNGADFAVDDIRIYKMNPELYVEREEACDENDLAVRAGYEHLLGVYGKNAGSKAETAIDSLQDTWQKQILHLGLLEDEFNVYYAFTDEYKKNALANSVHWLYLDYNNNGSRDSYGRVVVSTSKSYYDTAKQDIEQENKRRKAQAILDYKELYERFRPTEGESEVSGETLAKDTTWKHAVKPEVFVKKADSLGIKNLYALTVDDLLKNNDFLALSKFFFQSIKVAPIQLSWQTEADEERDLITLAHVVKTVPSQPEEEGKAGRDTGFDHSKDSLEVDREYHVGLFKDEDFLYESKGGITMDECFPVAPFQITYNGISVFVNTETEIEDATVCSFSSVRLSAKLKFSYRGEKDSLTGQDVPIDWYVGTMDDGVYTNITNTAGPDSVSLVEALNAFHTECADNGYRGTVGVLREMNDFEYQKDLLSLCDKELLYLNQNDFDFDVTEDRRDIVAIPNEVAIQHASEYSSVICTEPKHFTINVNENTPEAWLGSTDIDYPTDFEQPAVRLGLKDIENCRDNTLTIPIRDVEFSPEGEGGTPTEIGVAKEEREDVRNILFTGTTTDVPWVNQSGKVAELVSIDKEKLVLQFINLEEEGGTLKNFTFKEGFEYELQVRFHEYDENGNYMDKNCDGFINFKIKVVPEYVTWAGSENSRNWNNDGNWTRSSAKEIYKGSESNDASDPTRTDLENSFAPMKFTKVTIPGEGANPILLDCKWDNRVISGLEDDQNPATDDIEFDLMVDRESHIAGRFYANTCKEIYFKPNATLMSQQYLTYDTARVEFEMKEDQWYLLSSPLKGVVAGDMYSPKTDGGRQKTDAFAPIVFDYENEKNDRFEPAYYQRKWDNTAVLYFRNPGNAPDPDPDYHDSYLEAEWSTEYNDARVKYSTGTGFSVHVENLPEGGNDTSLVRLPKADREYSYYSNPQKGDVVNPDGAPQKIDREGNNGRLNPVDTAVVIGNRKEGSKLFLAGNPFMTYLNMKQFFDGNTDLKREYRVRNEKDEEIVVQVSGDGTATTNVPDGHSGAIAPLEGFFVEVQSTPSTKAAEEMQNEKVKITFSPGMLQADKETESLQTRSLVSGEPTLFITAHRDGKQSSVALVKRQQASVGFVDNEDAVALLNVSDPKTPSLYSIAGTQATCINVTPEMANIPLGVYSEDESDVTLRFAGLEHFGDSLYLYDALKNEEILIDSRNAEVTVPGATHGRYFLNVSRSIQVESQIRVYTPMLGQVVVASTAGDLLKSVRVYDLSGKVVSIFDHLSTTVHQFSLPTGFYIVCAESESCTEKSKISVR